MKSRNTVITVQNNMYRYIHGGTREHEVQVHEIKGLVGVFLKVRVSVLSLQGTLAAILILWCT